jgi:hypothetical protein
MSGEFISEDQIDRTFDALARERSFGGLHLAGGEATLNFDRLLYAIRSARKHRIELDYLETNAGWAVDEQTALESFRQMRDAGLDGVLISASLFHNEFTPLERTSAAIRAANTVFGSRAVLVWTSDLLQAMSRSLDPSKRHPLSRSCELLGIDPTGDDLWRLHSYLTPGGRAAERLSEGLPRHKAESFAGDGCGRTLSQTGHFHIDLHGNLFTGHCLGIAIGSVDDFHRAVSCDESPLFWHLYDGGPERAWRELAEGFEPDEQGYISNWAFANSG